MSQIFITNGQKGEALTHIRYRNILSNSHKKSLEDNSETFDFTTHADKPFSKFIDGMNRIIIPGEDNNFLEFIIYEVLEDRIKKELEVYSYASYAELITARSISPHTTDALSAEAHGNLALVGTEWEMGNVDFNGVRTITFDNYTNPYAYLKRIASEFDLELDFRIEHDNGNITGRYVDLVEKVGQWRGRRVEFGKDLIDLKRIVNTENIVTALRVVGPVQEDGSRLEVIVEDEEALQRWGRNGQHIIKEYEPQFEDIDNATIARLRELGEQELAKRVKAIVSYEGTIADLENVPGMENKKIRFGDTIQIKDTSYEPALYLDARIFFQDRDIKERAEKIVYLGDFTEYTEEDVHAIVRQLRKEVRNKIGLGDLEELTYTKPEVDQKVADVIDDAEKAAVEVVDSIEIGGRNIASIDSVGTTGVTRDGYTYTIAKTGSSNPFMRIPTSRFEENKRYVISFKVKKISGNVTSIAGHDQSFRGMPVEIYRDGVRIEDVTTWSVGDQNYPNDNEVHEYEIHIRTPETFPSDDSAPYWYIQPNRPNYGENYGLELWNFQIEQATKKSNWERPQDDVDKDIQDAKDEAEEAKQTAENAQQSANGKNTVFRQSSEPSSEGRIEGDLWFKTDEGNKMFVWTGNWTPTELDYQALSIGELSAISADLGDVTSGKMTAVEVEGVTGTFGKVSVTDGDFTLKDSVTESETIINTGSNIIHDHSFELIKPGVALEPIDPIDPYIASITTVDPDSLENFFGRWNNTVPSQARMVRSYDAESSHIYAGLNSIILRGQSYGMWDQICYIPEQVRQTNTLSLSCYVAPFEKTIMNVDVSLRIQLVDSSGAWLQDLASTSYTIDHTKKYNWQRVAVTYKGNLNLGGNMLRVRLLLNNNVSNAMLLCDGVQLVPFEHPTLYESENSLYQFMNGIGEAPQLVANNLAVTEYATIHDSWIGNTYIGNITHHAHSVLSLRNGWSNYGGSFQRSRFTKNADGMVYLSGMVTGGSFSSTIAILPVGSRPENTEIFGVDSGGSYGQVRVHNDGRITAVTGSASWVSLSGVVFRAASV